MTNDHEDLSPAMLRNDDQQAGERVSDIMIRWARERHQAADLIDRQFAEIARLKALLRDIANGDGREFGLPRPLRAQINDAVYGGENG